MFDINPIALGNIVSLISELVLLSSSAVSKRTHTLVLQAVSGIFNIAGYLILGGYAGAVVILISVVRSMLFAFGFESSKMRAAIIAAYIVVVTSVAAGGNFSDALWFMPLLANIIYTWWGTLKGHKFKLVVAANFMCWIPYSLSVLNFVSAGFEIVNVVLNVVVAYKLFKNDGQTQSK